MAKDPGFYFYPGDYLRDTQCLSEKSQVAYDRIMCEHMRNICISQQQLNFFTKRLNESEKEELMFLLTQKNGGFQIEWVAESILKRQKYSESRRNNRTKSSKKDMLSYDSHMEIEIEKEIEEDKEEENRESEGKKKRSVFIPPTMDQVKAYCKERGNGVNPDKWINHYIAKGWMIGKNKMKDWKAAVRTWENNTENEQASNSNQDAGVNILRFNK